MLRVVAAVAISVCAVLACAETRFTLNESNDKLSNALTRKLIVTAEDGRSTLELRQTEDSPVLTVFIDPASTIFPDDVDVPGSAMSVGVTMRSSAMDEPVSVKCDMNWMKYDFCYMKVTPKSARKLFTGDFIVMQLARTADRLTFPIGGAEYEQALSKVLEPAEEVARAKAAAEEMRKEETTRKQAAEQEAAAATERERVARELAQKPATDGRTAGKDLVAKVGDKVNGFGKASITGRAKTAAKKAGYEGEDAKMFVDGYVEAVQAAKGK